MALLLIPSLIDLSPHLSSAGTSQAVPFCRGENSVGTFCKINLDQLHPTQFSFGMMIVKEKRDKLRRESGSAHQLDHYLKSKPEPVVIGPNENFYIIDHHHLARALWEESIPSTYATILANYSWMNLNDFWKEMLNQGWFFPYDETGRGPLRWQDLPRSIQNLQDDPYRSLSGKVRDRGGYKKTSIPYAEAQWANFFRSQIQIKSGKEAFDKALHQALVLAQSPEARHLPGYLGPVR